MIIRPLASFRHHHEPAPLSPDMGMAGKRPESVGTWVCGDFQSSQLCCSVASHTASQANAIDSWHGSLRLHDDIEATAAVSQSSAADSEKDIENSFFPFPGSELWLLW